MTTQVQKIQQALNKFASISNETDELISIVNELFDDFSENGKPRTSGRCISVIDYVNESKKELARALRILHSIEDSINQ